MNINYSLETEKVFKEVSLLKTKPKLLLHSCCAPCSSYTILFLKDYFDLTIFYYNPNIYPYEEYEKRLSEQKKLAEILNIKVVDGTYDYKEYYRIIKGTENEKEGGARCKLCEGMRLRKTAEKAKEEGYDFFATTLSISPLKNAKVINELGVLLENEYKVRYLIADFKKKNGYLHSIELSKKYNLYRQNYCGCEFSINKKSSE